MTQKELLLAIKERAENKHNQAQLDLREILKTDFGFRFFVYLAEELDVGRLPQVGLEGNLLFDKLGALRAANSIFDMVNAVSPDTAGRILAQREKELHAIRLLEASPVDLDESDS